MWPTAAIGRHLIVAMLVLFVCDVIGGFIGVSEGVNTWGEAGGFNTESTVPLPVACRTLSSLLTAVTLRWHPSRLPGARRPNGTRPRPRRLCRSGT